MTRPSPDDPGAVPAIIWEHDAEALELEEKAAEATAGPLRRQIDGAVQRLRLRWVATFGSLRSAGDGRPLATLMAELAAELGRIEARPASFLVDYARLGRRLGVRQGFIESGLDPRLLPTLVPLRVLADAQRIEVETAQQVLRAMGMAATYTRGTFNQTVLRAVTPAQQAVAVIERAARTTVNSQLAAGISDVAAETGGRELWVAERDACVHCLALAGHLIGADGQFDASLTFGGKPLRWLPEGGLTGPPRHPNCRCRITIWFGHDVAGAESITHDWAGAIAEARARGDAVAEAAAHKAAEAARISAAHDLPAALRREAERSVLKGWALPSEPDSVRAQAAQRLLDRIDRRAGRAPSGWQVPKSVRKVTERDLEKGTFGAKPFPGR